MFRCPALLLALCCFLPCPAPAQAPPTVEVLAEGLDQPWALTELADGRLLITERPGRLRVFENGQLLAQAVEGLPPVLALGQGGLLEVLADRNHADNGWIYLTWSHGSRRDNATRLGRARLDGLRLVDLQVLFTARPGKRGGAHYGGRLAQLPDGSLVLGLGDAFSEREQAQRLDSHLGKIVRVGADGAVPADNPFVGRSEVLPEIYSFGHRNVQGIAWDAQRGVLWAHEHGPRGGDELNRIEPGVNYGWPVATAGRDYSGAQISPFASYDGMRDPLYGWTPSIAPAGLAMYRGEQFPGWDGSLLVTALAGRALHRLSPRSDGGFDEERLLLDLGERLREVRVASDGSVLLLTDSPRGKLLRLKPAAGTGE
ncbi:MAG: PQQ-dependent sugar dehydrogenase [Aquimonas sp.]|nr:PQQ-dependent sugar dehydrogenase [Aquimonas sp.]